MDFGYLAGYFVAGIAIVAAVLCAEYWVETGGDEAFPHDPYVLAYLRGFSNGSQTHEDGLRAAAEIAVLVLLLERKISADEDEVLRRTPGADPGTAIHELERAVLAGLGQKAKARDLVALMSPTLGKELEQQLRDEGLLPNEETGRRRNACLIAGVALLGALTAAALLATKPGLLPIEWVAALFVALVGLLAFSLWRPGTWRGRRTLRLAMRSSAELSARAALFDATLPALDLLWLGGVFGLDAIPARAFPYGYRVFRKVPPKRDGHRRTRFGSSGDDDDCERSEWCEGDRDSIWRN